MTVRSITLNEIDDFASLANDSVYLKSILLRLFAARQTHISWCFVAVENKTFVGGIIYWAFPNDRQHIKFTTLGLLLNWESQNNFSIGNELLLQSLEIMYLNGATVLDGRLIYDFTPALKEHKMLLKKIGIDLIQEKWQFEIQQPSTYRQQKYNSKKLLFKPLTEVNAGHFIDAIRQTCSATLDRADQKLIKKIGAHQYAQTLFQKLMQVDDDLSHYLLAYEKKGGALVGLVVPQRFSEQRGAVNYIGIVPNKRRQGYVDELLQYAIHILYEDGIKTIIADIDSRHIPLKKALLRVGFKKKTAIWCYKKSLSRLLGSQPKSINKATTRATRNFS
ncbi:MAG: GNAT family N-acetyltransferase [Chitinophagales bacterium]